MKIENNTTKTENPKITYQDVLIFSGASWHAMGSTAQIEITKVARFLIVEYKDGFRIVKNRYTNHMGMYEYSDYKKILEMIRQEYGSINTS